MNAPLQVYNTLSRQKEVFTPLKPPYVGMYVCGPTVYGEPHLGHARAAITFDIVFRYLQYLGYKVRYVRNITDVGHLENDADVGEDKIAKKAKLEQLEPMEIAHFYTQRYREDMKRLQVLTPSIEPLATGHIPEQIELIQSIVNNKLAYEANGSVYFDVAQYAKKENYGELSGRILEDLQNNTRDLDGQGEKKNPADFALWKKASPEHIMRWDAPWSKGFPGWHIECSAMSKKYLGEYFDIHGGGMDLMFPHHECEIAQSKAGHGHSPAKYWLHNNMVTINGQKMGKSLGNFITLQELFSGKHALLEQAYTPMTIRFFMLQAHYRSTLDFGNDALKAAKKGYVRLLNTFRFFQQVQEETLFFLPEDQEHPHNAMYGDEPVAKIISALSDDFNTAMAIAEMFSITKISAQLELYQSDKPVFKKSTFLKVKEIFTDIFEKVLGLVDEFDTQIYLWADDYLLLYKEAKEAKDYAKVDSIRTTFAKNGLQIKDLKNQVLWSYKES